MTKFVNGPAHGATLMLKRAPLYLRVVIDALGKIDALDQLADTPTRDETLACYKATQRGGAIHINSRGKQGQRTGGFFTMAEYAFVDPQPSDAEMRTTAAWHAWTLKQPRT